MLERFLRRFREQKLQETWLQEINRLASPLNANPSSCELFEKILASKEVKKMFRERHGLWAVGFMNKINWVNNRHDNPARHEST